MMHKNDKKAVKSSPEEHILFKTLALMVIAYLAGIGTVETIYRLAHLETVQKESFVLKEKIDSMYVSRSSFDSVMQILNTFSHDSNTKEKKHTVSEALSAHTLSHTQTRRILDLIWQCDNLLSSTSDNKTVEAEQFFNEVLVTLGTIDKGLQQMIADKYKIEKNRYYSIPENLEGIRRALTAIIPK